MCSLEIILVFRVESCCRWLAVRLVSKQMD